MSRRDPLPFGLDGDALRRAVARLHRWYAREARALPWRETRDPYAIWVSEVMLQQTQVTTVIPYYRRWLERFPTLEQLAAADEGEVLLCWEGLGYYRRARALHRAAREVVERHAALVPRDPERFRALPGVGAYTAAAVMSIAFDEDLAAVDGNVRRVLARLAALDSPIDAALSRELERLASALLPPGTAALHNQALMELGALICTPRSPSCDACPLAGACEGLRAGEPERYPVKRARPAVPHHHLAVAVIRDAEGRLLLFKRPYGGMLAGLWDLPARRIEEGDDDARRRRLLREAVAEEHGLAIRVETALPPVQHAYSHLRVTLHPFACRPLRRSARRAADADTERSWVPPGDLGSCAMPRASHKVLATSPAEA